MAPLPFVHNIHTIAGLSFCVSYHKQEQIVNIESVLTKVRDWLTPEDRKNVKSLTFNIDEQNQITLAAINGSSISLDKNNWGISVLQYLTTNISQCQGRYYFNFAGAHLPVKILVPDFNAQTDFWTRGYQYYYEYTFCLRQIEANRIASIARTLSDWDQQIHTPCCPTIYGTGCAGESWQLQSGSESVDLCLHMPILAITDLWQKVFKFNAKISEDKQWVSIATVDHKVIKKKINVSFLDTLVEFLSDDPHTTRELQLQDARVERALDMAATITTLGQIRSGLTDPCAKEILNIAIIGLAQLAGSK